MTLDQIISVSITRQTAAIAEQDISTINIVSHECNFTDRIRFYTDLAGAAADLIGGTGSYTYRLIQKAFSQPKRPTRIAVSNIGSVKCILFDSGTWTSGSVSVIVNGVTYTQAWTSSKAATIAALVTQLNNLATVDCTSVSGNSYTALLITSTSGLLTVSNLSVTRGGSDTVVAAINRVGRLMENGGTYTAGNIVLTVGTASTTVAWGTDKATTMAAIATAIASNSSSNIPIASYVSGDSCIYFIPAIGSTISVSADLSNITGTLSLVEGATFSETVADALDAIRNVSDEWYWILSTLGVSDLSTIENTKRAFMAWTETQVKYYACETCDPVVRNSSTTTDTTSIAYTWRNNAYKKSTIAYRKLPSQFGLAAGAVGYFSPLKPGGFNTKFRTLSGVSVDTFTANEEINLIAKGVLFYTRVAGINITSAAKSGDGEWLDTIVGIDWIVGKIKTSVFGTMVNNLKLPYDDRGITAVGEAVETGLSYGLPNADYAGLWTQIMKDKDGNIIGGYIVTVPRASAIAANDKNNRVLNNVRFTAWLSGAINSVVVEGVVTV